MSRNKHSKTPAEQTLQGFIVVLLLMVGIQCINSLTGGWLSTMLGLRPRHLNGLQGIIFSPLLHGSWSHLLANLPPLLVLSAVLMLRSFSGYVQGSLFIIIISGALVWCFGRSNSIHIGASGWVFGLWAWLLSRAYFQRSLVNFTIAILVLFFYGGLVFGLLPKQGVSVEGHLAGVVAGVLVALTSDKKGRK